MSRKYKDKNPLIIKWMLRYLYKRANELNKSTHKRFAKEDIKSLAYYFGLHHFHLDDSG